MSVSSDAADNIAIINDGTNVLISENGAPGINPGGGPAVAANTVTNLQVNGFTGTFDNEVDLVGVLPSVFTALETVDVDAGAGNDTTFLGSGLTTTQGQTYADAVVLTQSTTVKSTAGADIRFLGTIDSDVVVARSLSIRTSGFVELGDGGADYIGAVNPLQEFSTTGTTKTTFNMVDTAQPTVTTLATQAYGEKVILASDVQLVGNGIFFTSAINSEDATARSLVIDSGNDFHWFGGDVGGTFALSTVSTSGDNTLFFVTAISINTTGDQSYDQPIKLLAGGANFLLDAGTLTFGGSLTGTTSDILADADKVIVNGGSADETITLGHTAGTPSFSFDGVTNVLYPNATSFEFNGGAGDDVLVVNYTGGNPIPTAGLLFDGQGQGPNGDRLALNGAGNAALYQPDAAISGAGTVVVDGRTVQFTGLEPIDITGMSTVTVAPAGVDDVLTVSNGFDFATGAIPAMRISGTTGGVPIETVALWNNTTVSINTTTNDGNDTVTFDGADNAHGNTNLTVITGTGTDQLDVNGPVAVTGDVNMASQQINLAGGISAVNVALNAGGGSIADTNAGANNISAFNLVATATTGIELDTTVDTINASTSGTGSIVLRETDAVLLINLTNADGNIDVTSGGMMTAINVVAGGTSRDIDLTTTTGDIAVGTITALGDAVRLMTPMSLTDANGLATNVSASDFVAIASDGIDLDTAVDKIDASVTSAGAIVFRELDDVILNNITTTDGNINVVSGGTMTVTLVTSGGVGRDVDLETTSGSMAVGIVNADDRVSLTSAAEITDNNAAVTNITAESVNATAVLGVSLDTNVATLEVQNTGVGAIDLEEVDDVAIDSVTTFDGRIDVVAGGTITATLITAGGASRDLTILSTGGGIGVGFIGASSDRLDLTAATSITDLNGANQNLNAAMAVLIASGGIGTAADSIESSIGAAEIASGSGGVFIKNSGNLVVGLISPLVGISSTGGDIVISTTGALLIPEDIVATTGKIMLAALDSAETDEHLRLGNRASIRSNTGDITLEAGDDVELHVNTRVETPGRLSIAGDVGNLDPFGSLIKLDGAITAQSVDITSGNDDDTLMINETVAGQFNFSGAALGSHTNDAFLASGRGPGNVGAHFEAGLGNDALVINFTLPQDVAYFSDTNEPNSGMMNVLNNYTLSFDGLAPIHLSGATGTLLVDATATPATTFLTIDDNEIPDDGVMVLTADGGVEQTTFSGFTNLKLRGGDSAETFTVRGLDSSKPLGLGGPLAHVELDGSNTQDTDIGNDVFNIRTLPGTISLSVLGGLGNDTINISSDAPLNMGTIDPIVGPIHVDGQDGSDTLVVSDKSDSSNDVATLTSSTLTGMGLTSAITYLNIDQFDLFFGAGRDELVLMLPLPSPVEAPLPSLIRIQGGPDDQDKLTVIGTNNPNVVDEAIVGTFGSSAPIQIQEIEILQMFGYAGPDRFINNTAVPSFLVGGDGPDTLQGGSASDTIFGGDSLDQLFGNNADDFLFPDHDIVGGLVVERILGGDLVDGGNGFDSVLALGFGDLLRFISQSIDTGSIQDVITWLRGQFIPDTPAGRAALLNAGLAISNSESIADPAAVPPAPPEVDLSGVVFENNLFVQRAYFDYLDRDPALDPVGVQHFSAKVVGGASIEQMRSEILASPEYFGKSGNTTNAGFIVNLYADLLTRAPSQAEIDVWLGVLANSATRGDVALLILVSAEARNVQVGEIYDQIDGILFNGVAPPPGANDVDRLAMLADFAGGSTIAQAERQLRAATAAGKQYASVGVGDAASFVIGLYRNPAILGREPAESELAPWLTALANGTMTPKLVAYSILTSVEKQTRDIERIYQDFLGRDADPQALTTALAIFTGGGRIESLESGVLASNEYFQLHDGSNSGFVSALYMDVLGRAGSAAEIAQFATALNSGATRGTLTSLFVNSVEARTRVINLQYEQTSARMPTDGELATSLERFGKGETRDQILLRLILGSG